MGRLGKYLLYPPVTQKAAKEVIVRNAFTNGDDKNTEQFQTMLKRKKHLEEAVGMFNQKPKKGISFLMEHLLTDGKPEDVAKFFRTTEGLDATAVGEFLGEADEFAVSVMSAYTDLHDFNGSLFDDAIRQYLSSFRLPGEAQKIDRIMQKFASRFCVCNPNVFASADTAYVLAYSVIMLNTDAHNAQVKSKMSKEQFIRNNRGIDDGADLDVEFLGSLFDRINDNEIKISGVKKDKRGDEAIIAALGIPDGSNFSARAKLFKTESEQLLQKTKIQFAQRKVSPQDYVFYRATNVCHARLMFESTWEPVLAVISYWLLIADASDMLVTDLCLRTFRNAIAITMTFGMESESLRFVSELVHCAKVPLSQVEVKNVECMKMLIAVCNLDRERLQDLWGPVIWSASTLTQIKIWGDNSENYYLLPTNPTIPLTPVVQTVASPAEIAPEDVTVDDRKKRQEMNAMAFDASESKPLTPPRPHGLRSGEIEAASRMSTADTNRMFANSSELSLAGEQYST